MKKLQFHFLKSLFVAGLLFFSGFHMYGQIDSLKLVLKDESIQDSTRIKTTLLLANKIYVSEPKVALQYLKGLDQIINLGTQKQQIGQLHYYGTTYHNLNKIDSAEYFHNKIISQISKEEYPRQYARAKSNLGIVEEMRGNLSKAASYYEETIKVFEVNQDTFPLAATLNNLGLVHDRRGDHQGAKNAYLKAFSLFAAKGHEGAQASVLTNLGKLSHSQKSYDEAIEFYRKSYTLAVKNNKNLSQGILLDNIGGTYIDLNVLDSAKIYLERGLLKRKEIEDERGIGISYSNLGNLAFIEKNFEEALTAYRQSKLKATVAQDKHTIATANIKEGQTLKELNQFSNAIKSLKTGLKEAQSADDIQLIYLGAYELYEIYKDTDQQQALKFLELSNVMQDSIMNEESIRELANLEMQFEFNQKEILNKKEIENLELKDQIQISRIKNQRRGLLGLGIGFSLILLMFANIFRKNKKIDSQNHLIQKSLDEKNVLLKEIHHRVKNNLQVISSLLKIQSRYTDDEVAIDALKESETRVRSMALIHQNLYQKENVTGIKMNDYLDKLINNIFSTYNISNERVSVQTDIEDIDLDVDTVIPLGLIINELVTNALKYGFPDNNKGTITVRLNQKNNKLHLEVQDNGKGIENIEDMDTQKSFGYKLIKSFQKKLNAELIIENENGTKVQLIIDNF